MQLHAGRPRSLPLADVVSGADGRFILSNVSSIYPPFLTWFPSEDWLGDGISVAGESFASVDVGVIELEPATKVTVAVELANSSGLIKNDRDPTVVLVGQPGWPRMVAEKIGTEHVIRGISFEEGTWEVSLYTSSGTENYSAPFHLKRGSQGQKFTLRLLRNTVKPAGQYDSTGEMEVSMGNASVANFTRNFSVRARVEGPDGSPIEGALVSSFNLPFNRSMVQWVRTGTDGSFDLKYQATHCIQPSVSYGDSDYWNLYFSKPSLRDLPCERWLQTRQTIVMPNPSRLSIQVSGLDISRVGAAWWHDSLGWQHFSSLRPWVPAWGLLHAVIRLDADGYLPLTQKLEVPSFDTQKSELPADFPMRFSFDSSVRRSLSIKGAGKPLTNAIVDLECIVNLASDERRFLNTYTIPVDGRLQLLGGGDQMIEAFVYAEGFEPRRLIWNSGAPLEVELKARSSSFEFPASHTVAAARIRKVGSPRAVRTVVLRTGQRMLARVEPGRYDITCYSTSGTIMGYQRLAVANVDTTTVDCSVDQRPRLTVRFPGKGWRLTMSESTLGGGATQWLAMISVPGLPGFPDVGATVVSESETETIFALSHGGKWHLEVREDRRTLSLWREIEIQPNASTTLALPAKLGTLKGSMRTYGGGLERADHGFAGPRLQLVADDPEQWSVTEYLPERDARDGEAKHRFTLTGIPAGNYHLYQHLIGEPKSYTYGARTTTYTSPINAWGGIPVNIKVNSAAVLRDFNEYPLSDLSVRVTSANGEPVEHATLRIRDRMSESWRQVEENPAQLEQASHPIPYPAAVRIVGGRAILPRVREGWLDLSVETDNGTAFSFTVAVSTSRKLNLTLPAE